MTNHALPVSHIQEALLTWFRRHARDLPWRRTKDPYRVWVSEVMLQQTQVDRAIDYFNRFIERFPTVGDLALADVEEVLDAWAGLGYYRRARFLHAAAREIAASCDGVIPHDPEAFGSLPGVGPYTAGAVLSIAFDQPVPAVDGNVMRVLARLLGMSAPIDKAAGRKQVNRLAQQLVPPDAPGDWNQAVMELGALICRPQNPRCGECPLRQWCRAAEDGTAEALPVVSPRKEVQRVKRLVAVVRVDGCLYLQRRPREGLLAGLWDFPAVEGPPEAWPLPGEREAALTSFLIDRGFTKARVQAALGTDTHRFSHVEWDIHVYGCVAEAGPRDPEWRAVKPVKARRLIVARAIRRAFDVAVERGWLEEDTR